MSLPPAAPSVRYGLGTRSIGFPPLPAKVGGLPLAKRMGGTPLSLYGAFGIRQSRASGLMQIADGTNTVDKPAHDPTT